jgi:hypothetical protein
MFKLIACLLACLPFVPTPIPARYEERKPGGLQMTGLGFLIKRSDGDVNPLVFVLSCALSLWDVMLNEIFRVPCLRDAQDKDELKQISQQLFRDDARITVGTAQ